MSDQIDYKTLHIVMNYFRNWVQDMQETIVHQKDQLRNLQERVENQRASISKLEKALQKARKDQEEKPSLDVSSQEESK